MLATATTPQTINPRPFPLHKTLTLIACAFTSYITFKTTHARRIRRAKARNDSNLRLIGALGDRLAPDVGRQERGLLSAAEDAQVLRLIEQLSEMVEMVEMQIGMTAEMQRTLEGVGVGAFWREERRKER